MQTDLEPLATTAGRLDSAVDRAAMHAETGDDITGTLTLAHTLNRHLVDGFQHRVIVRAPSRFIVKRIAAYSQGVV